MPTAETPRPTTGEATGERSGSVNLAPRGQPVPFAWLATGKTRVAAMAGETTAEQRAALYRKAMTEPRRAGQPTMAAVRRGLDAAYPEVSPLVRATMAYVVTSNALWSADSVIAGADAVLEARAAHQRGSGIDI